MATRDATDDALPSPEEFADRSVEVVPAAFEGGVDEVLAGSIESFAGAVYAEERGHDVTGFDQLRTTTAIAATVYAAANPHLFETRAQAARDAIEGAYERAVTAAETAEAEAEDDEAEATADVVTQRELKNEVREEALRQLSPGQSASPASEGMIWFGSQDAVSDLAGSDGDEDLTERFEEFLDVTNERSRGAGRGVA